MSNSRQFQVPLNYDITKQVYHVEEDVHTRTYNIDQVISTKQYYQLDNNTAASRTKSSSAYYADKLRRRAKLR